MSKDEKSRQKKLALKSAKRKAKQRQIRAAGNLSKVEQVARHVHKPLLACVVPGDLFEAGIGSVLFARGSETGEVVMAVFLLDVWCLGIKDVMFRVGSSEDYAMARQGVAVGGELEDWEPACVKKLLESLTAWSRNLGFNPHPDVRQGMALIGADVDTSECQREFLFGKDGKPFYFSGPHDGLRKSRHIVETLLRHCGEGNFDFVIASDDMTGDDTPTSLGVPMDILGLGENAGDDAPDRLIEGELDDGKPSSDGQS